jgi:hypothetical protein
MLKWYFNNYDKFPKSRTINKAWQYYRTKAYEKLQDISLKTIRLYDLRHIMQLCYIIKQKTYFMLNNRWDILKSKQHDLHSIS